MPKDSNVNTVDLVSVVGKDVINILTPAEERRLKIDLKKGIDIKDSQILKDIMLRCPSLRTNLNTIIKTDTDNILNISHKRKRDDNENPNHNNNKRARLAKEINIDTESDELLEEDDYIEDGFVIKDNHRHEIDQELNDLHDDLISKKMLSELSQEEERLIQSKLKSLRDDYSNARIEIATIIKANFNKDDAVWFYKNLKRVPLLEGNEKFKLEDMIEKRYKFLSSLQDAGMYTTFLKGADRDILQDILKSNQPDNVKTVLLNRMCNVSYESIEEYQKALNWLDTILSIPTKVRSSERDISKSIQTLHEKLSSNLCGMDETIREILQAVCTILTDPDNKGYILTLEGPPGVGKTSISSMISEAIGMGFGQVSCGSINDQAVITGHGSTYIGSKPGIFTQYLINNGQLDNVILLDEMDKMQDPKVLPNLLHILDKSQNSRFRDAFCPEVMIDLSKNFYIVAVNSVDNLDHALRDRLKVVRVNGYNVDTKTHICIRHIVPKLNKKTGIDLIIDERTIKKYIRQISPSVSGVRDLERFFDDIYEKLLLIKHMGPEYFNLPNTFDVNKLKKIDNNLITKLKNL